MKAGAELIRNEQFLCEYKKCELSRPGIDVKVKERNGEFEISLNTDHPAIWLSFEATGIPGEFDDNAFTLLPDRPRAIRFSPRGKTSLAQFRKSLKIRHLRDTYI
jgi:beta-mannosidase